MERHLSRFPRNPCGDTSPQTHLSLFRGDGPEPGGGFRNVLQRTGAPAGSRPLHWALRGHGARWPRAWRGPAFPTPCLSPKRGLLFSSQTSSHFQTLRPTTSSLRLRFLISGGNCASAVSSPWQVWSGNHWLRPRGEAPLPDCGPRALARSSGALSVSLP